MNLNVLDYTIIFVFSFFIQYQPEISSKKELFLLGLRRVERSGIALSSLVEVRDDVNLGEAAIT